VASTAARAIERQQSEPGLEPVVIAAANINLGIEYMRRKEYDKAMEKLTVARKAAPKHAPVYNALGLLSQRMGDARDAERNFRHALRIDKNNSNIMNNYGQFLCTMNRHEEAERYFLDAALNPLYETPEIPYTNAGTCACNHGKVNKAVTYFEKALSIEPYIPTALLQMAEISYRKNAYLVARDYLKAYLYTSKHTEKSLWIGILIEQQLDNKNVVSSYALLLRNKFPETEEAKSLKESGIR
jgi:type IV pilus assembly protein PilF